MTPTNVMSATDAVRITENAEKRQEEILVNLRKWRAKEVKTKAHMERVNVQFGKLEDKMGELHRLKLYEVAMDPEMREIIQNDPLTGGEPSQDWAMAVIERALLHDEEWQALKEEFYRTQNELMEAKNSAVEAQSRVMEFSEELMSQNANIRLKAALWTSLGNLE